MKTRIVVSVAFLLALPGLAFAQPFQPSGPFSGDASGWTGGAQFGANWQRGSFVYGFEADFSATQLKSEINSPNNVALTASPLQPQFALFPGSGNNTTASVDWYGTFRARFGWASGPFLFYGTGGLAYGQVNLSQTSNSGPVFQQNAAIAIAIAQTPILQDSSVKIGGVAGVGVDYMLNRNLIVNFAYQYVDLGSVSLTSLGPFQTPGPNSSVHARFQVVTVGLSWRFNAPDAAIASRQSPSSKPQQLPSNPWEGIYVGGHVGGAWGNTTTVTQPAFVTFN
jgi:outer membrane immunogenic protein